MNDNQILLIVLQSTKEYGTERVFEHLGCGYLMSALRKLDFSVRLIDQNVTKNPLEQIIAETVTLKPEVIGISCYQDSYLALAEFVKVIKARLPKTHISLGGVFATNSTAYILQELPEVDSIILGEGETTFTQLVQAIINDEEWSSHPHITFPDDPNKEHKYPSYDQNLDLLTEPARDTLPIIRKLGMSPLLIASRGCYGRCSYCSITSNNRQRRLRDIRLVIEEMERLYHDYQVNHIQIIDDTFIGGSNHDLQRIETFAHQLIQRNLDLEFTIECRTNEVDSKTMSLLKQAGLRSVFLGVESGYQPTLDLFQKDVTVQDNERAVEVLQTLNIHYKVGFIMFHPYTTLKEIEANLNFLFKTDQWSLLYSLKNMLQVFPKTPIADTLLQESRLKGPWYNYTYDFLDKDIAEIYNYIIFFFLRILPGLEKLSIRYRQEKNSNLVQKMAELNGKICSQFIDTIFTYLNKPDHQLLKDQAKNLLNLNKEVAQLV